MLKVTYNERRAGDAALLQKAAFARIARAAALLHARLLEALNVPNTGRRVRRARRGGARAVYDSPSRPGEPPRKRTGWLQKNVVHELDERKGTAKVGVTANAPYGAYLELGTARVAARPWLLATLEKCLPEVRATIAGRSP